MNESEIAATKGEQHAHAVTTPNARDHLWLVLAPFVGRPGVSTDELLDALLDHDALVMDFLAHGEHGSA